LQTSGNLVSQTPDNNYFYLSGVAATVQGNCIATGYLELDGKWYALSTGFVQTAQTIIWLKQLPLIAPLVARHYPPQLIRTLSGTAINLASAKRRFESSL